MAVNCSCADGANCTSASHGLINGACDEYIESLRGSVDTSKEDALWQSFYGERVPVNQLVINAWRTYYDDMEALDRRYPHGPARRSSRGSLSVIPQVSAQWHPNYYKDKKRITDLLHRALGGHGRSPTSEGYSEKDMAMHEHERAMVLCECRECMQYR